jgi:hypothetical protein
MNLWDTRPEKSNLESANQLREVFKKWHIDLSKINNKSLNINEFGLEIKELLISKEITERVKNEANSQLAGRTMWDGFTFSHTAKNMEALAEKLGFAIHPTSEFYYVRDLFFRLHNGDIRIARSSPHMQMAVLRTHSSNLYLNKTAATRTKNQFFNSWSGYTHTVSFSQDIQKYFEECPSFKYTYAEGGNAWIMTNSKGEQKVLLGNDHFIQTLNILEMEQSSWDHLIHEVFANRSFESLQQEIASTLSLDEIKKRAEEMYAEGILLCNGYSGLIDRKMQLHLMMANFLVGKPIIEETNWFQKLGVQLGVIKPFKIDDGIAEKSRALVAGYLARQKITQALIAHDFGVGPNNLHFITQFNYHLDTFMRPGPQHSIFLINFALWADILEAIGKEISLSKVDREFLENYIATSKKLDRELGPLLKKVEEELKAAHFEIIPLPGHLLYESKTMYQEFPMPSGGFNINFINSLTGWSSKTKKFYYITHGIQVGERLGDLLMEAFVQYLNQYIPDIEVYFIGRNPNNQADFSEAMDWWNRLETQSGIHCTTFELKLRD